MGSRVELLPSALAEAEEAARWYAERSPRAAAVFEAELAVVIEGLEHAPLRWPRYRHGARRALLHRFPYLVVFRVRRDHVLVVAVAHAKRRPGYWRRRR